MKSLFSGIAAAIKNQTPVPYASRHLSFPWSNTNNQENQMRAMGSVGTLFSIVNRTSNSTAQVCWKLYRKSNNGERVEVTRHLALDIWNKPNKFMTGHKFRETFQQHLDLTGEAWWVVGRDARLRSIPLSLWPVRPDKMAPIPHPTEFIEKYEYTGPNGERIPLEIDEVIFLKMPNPLDPYRGMGPVQSILADLDSVRYSAEWNRNFFINGAEPGGVVEIDERLSDTQFEEFNLRWEEQHKGVANAFRVALLEGGAKWVERKFTNRDMQFVEMRSVSREVIREAFGIPKFAIGDVEDVNRATAEASKAWFAEALTIPRLERIKGALNSEFLPLFGSGSDMLEFDYDSPLPDDEETEATVLATRSKAASDLIAAGWHRDDVAEAAGLPKMRPAAVAPLPPDEGTSEPTMRVVMELVQLLRDRDPKDHGPH